MVRMASGGDVARLREIEAVLGRHPRVHACAVAREAEGDRSVAACVATDRRARAHRAELVGHLTRALPAHLLPAKWVYLDRVTTGAWPGP